MFRQNFTIVVVSKNMKSTESLRFLNVVFIKTIKSYVSSFKYLRDFSEVPIRCLVVRRLSVRLTQSEVCVLFNLEV
jgi:hypothetical protein